MLMKILLLISVGTGGHEPQNLQHVGSSMSSMRGECLTQSPQLELVSHSIVSASSPPALCKLLAF